MWVIDLLFTAMFVGFLFWGFWPRYLFVSLVEENGLAELTVRKSRKLLFDETLTFKRKGLHGKWFTVDGDEVDSVLTRRLNDLYRFGTQIASKS